MKNHLITTAIYALGIMLVLPVLSFAQFNATDNFYPVIDTSTAGLGPNQVRFSVRFPSSPVDTNAFSDPPKPLPQITIDSLGLDPDIEPAWVYFWEFGDGTYSKETSPVHTYTNAGDYPVNLRMVAIYSRNNEPTILKGNGSKVKLNQSIAAPPQSNFDPDDFQRQIKVESNWNAAKTLDTITMAMSFRNTRTNSETPKGGEVKFKLPLNGFSVVGTRIPQSGITFKNISTTFDSLIFTWEFDPLNVSEEKAVFIDFRVDPGTGEADTENYDALGKIIFDEDQPNDGGGLSIPELLGFSDNQDIGSVGVPNGNAEPLTQIGVNADNEHFKVSRARDPNSIEVTPKAIPPGKKVVALNYRINYQNLGQAPVTPVKLRSFLEPKHDISTLPDPGFGFNFEPFDGSLTGPNFTTTPTVPEWVISKPGGVVFPFESGLLDYPIKTKEIDFKVGDRIKGEALIIFGSDDTLRTDRVFTKVIDNRIRLPWYWGVKFGFNNQLSDFANGLSKGGWHAGITFRKGFGKIPASYSDNAIIPTTVLPSFWYQIELMYNNFKTIDTLSGRELFNYQFVELVPFQIRYFPNLNAGFIKKGFLGISGGYKASLILQAKKADTELDLPDFFDRIENVLFAEASVFNNLGIPGLSLGYRINWRLNKVFDDDVEDRYYQIYVHLNL